MESPFGDEKRGWLGPRYIYPQMTQITQIKTRTGCDGICVNLRDLRASRLGGGNSKLKTKNSKLVMSLRPAYKRSAYAVPSAISSE